MFDQYQQKEYAAVIAGADTAIVQFKDDPLVPKFKYIKAISVGAMSGKEEMKVELDSLIAQHPTAEESIQAQEIIDYMYVAFPVIKEADQAKEAEVIYTNYDPEQEHYFLIALHSSENVNQVSFDLLNYNLDNFNQYDLSIEQINMTDSYNMLVVKTFINFEGATRYLQVIEENRETLLTGIDPSKYRMMIISTDNFEILMKRRSLIPITCIYVNH